MAVPHIAVVASTIVVRITHDGIARAPLIAGRTMARAVTAGLFKTPIGWAMAGLLAARLSSHSVFPKLCKRHLQFMHESWLPADYRFPAMPQEGFGEADGVAEIHGARPTFALARSAKCKIWRDSLC